MKLSIYFLFLVGFTVAFDLQHINEKLDDAFCKLQCYDNEFSSCFADEECECSNHSIFNLDSLNMTQYGRNDLKLKCKAEDMFHVEWDKNISPFMAANHTAYFLHVVSPKEDFFTEVTFCNYYSVETFSNTTYIVTLWGVDDGNNIFASVPLTVVTTNKGASPLPVSNITLDLIPDVGKYQAMVKWTPAADLSCYYEIILYCTNSANTHSTIPAPDTYEITKDSDVFNFYLPIEELQFGNNYSLTIRSKGVDFENESTNTTITVVVPTCLETYKNLTICEPDKPRNLTIAEVMTKNTSQESSTMYDIHLKWSKPLLVPDYYIARLNIINMSRDMNSTPILNISGEATSAVFEHIELSSYYQIHLQAVSAGGRSAPAVLDRLSVHPLRIPQMTQMKMDNLKTLLIILGIVGGVAGAGLISLHIRQRRINKENESSNNENQSEKEKNNKPVQGGSNNQIVRKMTDDKWEISMERLSFKTILGEGAFGIVWQAAFGHIPVACKTLKENCTADEIRQLQQEIEIMKYVGSHPNIVSMIGCITENVSNGPILIVEYCSKGDLLSYLRNIYNNIASQLNKAMNNDNKKESNDFTNKLYELNWNEYEDQFSLSQMDVISFGRQIAMGMEYLSTQKVLHRDLAARNILMCEDKKVKVSDFGLSRDVYMDSVYCKTTNGKLPVRWMALESLTHQIYTSQSDVWSFGVLLWEIVSLGAIPYPGVETHELLAMLKRGERMAKPHLCSDEMYSVMTSCWKESPNDRPSFSSLRAAFEAFLTNETDYLELNTSM